MGEAGLHPGPVPPAVTTDPWPGPVSGRRLSPGRLGDHATRDLGRLARASGRPLDLLLADLLTVPLDAPSMSFAAPARQVRAPAYSNEGGGWRVYRSSRTRPQRRPCSPCRADCGPPRRTPRTCSGSSSRRRSSPRMPWQRCGPRASPRCRSRGGAAVRPRRVLVRPPGLGRDRRRPAGPPTGVRRLERGDGHARHRRPRLRPHRRPPHQPRAGRSPRHRRVRRRPRRPLVGRPGGLRRGRGAGRRQVVARVASSREPCPHPSVGAVPGRVGSRTCCAWASPGGSARGSRPCRPSSQPSGPSSSTRMPWPARSWSPAPPRWPPSPSGSAPRWSPRRLARPARPRPGRLRGPGGAGRPRGAHPSEDLGPYRRDRRGRRDDAVVVHDMPLIVEKGMGAQYHLVVVVGAAEEVRVRRLVELRGMREADARARIAAQATTRHVGLRPTSGCPTRRRPRRCGPW